MSRPTRRNHTAAFAAKAAYPNRITDWKSRLLEGAAGAFGSEGARQAPAVDVKTPHAKTGGLTLENDFPEGALSKAGMLSAKR